MILKYKQEKQIRFMSKDKEKQAKLKALQLTLDKLDKTYGKGSVMKMGDSVVEEVEAISSGSEARHHRLHFRSGRARAALLGDPQ